MKKHPKHSRLSSSEIIDLWEHACLLYHSYEWQSAADAFSALEHYTSDPGDRCTFMLNRGLIEARLGDLGLALASFTQALAYEKDNHLAHFFLGLVHAEKYDYRRGQSHFELCLDSIDTYTLESRTRASSFSLDRLTVVDNINSLQSRTVAATAESGQTKARRPRLHTIPADILFEAPSRSDSTFQVDRGSRTTFTFNAEPHKDYEAHLRDPISRPLQPTEVAGHDANSTHLIEETDSDPAVLPPSCRFEEKRQPKRLVARDAQVRDDSMRELARFLRHAGPSENENVTVDRKYMQRLLAQGNNADRLASEFLSQVSESSIDRPPSTPPAHSHSHPSDDFGSLLELYTEARTRTLSGSTMTTSTASESTARLHPTNPQRTMTSIDVAATDRERPYRLRRPTLEAAQRWLRKEVRPSWFYKLAASEQRKSARDRSYGALLDDERDEQSLPSVVSSTEMFSFGRPGGKFG
jgi:hypothetical protein